MNIKQHIEDTMASRPKTSSFNLSSQNLTDSDIEALVPLLKKYPQIAELDLSHNKLNAKSAALLAQNKTLRKLKLYEGNSISIDDLRPFLENSHLIYLPIRGGSGSLLTEIREHIKKNGQAAAAPVILAVPVPPAPVVLAAPILAAPPAPATLVASILAAPPVPAILPAAIVPPFSEKASAYLNKAVTQKKKTGELNFQELFYACLLDLEHFPSETQYAAWYMAIAANLYMHNASYSPKTGYGKVQLRESNSLLLYYRSQIDHPHRRLFDRIVKTAGMAKSRSKGLLPVNAGYKGLIDDQAEESSLSKNLNKIDGYGFPSAELSEGFGLFLAHSGARSNNLSAYISAFEYLAGHSSAKTLPKMAKKSLEFKALPKKIEKLEKPKLIARINELNSRFKDMLSKISFSYTASLYSKTFAQRSANASQMIVRSQALGLKNLSLKTVEGTSCLYIELYPSWRKDESKNYSEGVTNALIGFFGGLINYYAKQKGLYIQTERRQSFGFLRSTLTDVGSMQIRLSLGLEPAVYNEVLMQSLQGLDTLLAKYDFRNRQDPALKEYFETCEQPIGKDKTKITEKTGNYFLAAMRSDHHKWQALSEAEYQLAQNPSSLDTAFTEYLKQFVKNKGDITAKKSEALNSSVLKAKDDSSENSQSSIIFYILQNLLRYALDFTAKLEPLSEKEMIANFAHSYWHSLSKLYNNCDKALALIAQIEKYQASHLYAKANLLIENILEYLISLDSLELMRNKANAKTMDPVAELRLTEQTYNSSKLNIPQDQINCYFTDNGQQANTASIFAMRAQVYPTEKSKNYSDNNVYVFEQSYYELDSFFNDFKGLSTPNKQVSNVVFMDIACIGKFDRTQFPQLKSVIIDITHQPNLDNARLKALVQDLYNNGIWVNLTTSSLKHEQLGLDKYQSGRIITIAPKGDAINRDVDDLLSEIDSNAMHPAIASYLSIVNSVYAEKPVVKPAVPAVAVPPLPFKEAATIKVSVAPVKKIG